MLFRALLCVFASLAAASAQTETAPEKAPPETLESRLDFHGYSTVNYYHFAWQTDPNRRDAVDLERAALEFAYRVTPRIIVNSEIEFEHGGTGSALEFDKREEFGEFETETEKGGEVTLEELNVAFLLHPMLNVRLGHFFVPIGFAAALDEPTDYFTVERSEAERSMLPVLWDETGAELFGDLPGVSYQLQMVNGLDATYFGSRAWIAMGHQGRYETVNAGNWAFAGRLESNSIPFTRVGVSGYFGNSRDNRAKPDLNKNAYVSIVSAQAQWVMGPFTVRGLGILGNLSKSAAVSAANLNLPDVLNADKTPVAKEAYAGFAEAGVDVLRLTLPRVRQSGIVYARFDSYDTMFKTEGAIVDHPKYDNQVVSGGVSYKPHPQVVLKGQYAHRVNGDGQSDDTYSLGLGVVVF